MIKSVKDIKFEDTARIYLLISKAKSVVENDLINPISIIDRDFKTLNEALGDNTTYHDKQDSVDRFYKKSMAYISFLRNKLCEYEKVINDSFLADGLKDDRNSNTNG